MMFFPGQVFGRLGGILAPFCGTLPAVVSCPTFGFACLMAALATATLPDKLEDGERWGDVEFLGETFFQRVAVTLDSGFQRFHSESRHGAFLWVWPIHSRDWNNKCIYTCIYGEPKTSSDKKHRKRPCFRCTMKPYPDASIVLVPKSPMKKRQHWMQRWRDGWSIRPTGGNCIQHASILIFWCLYYCGQISISLDFVRGHRGTCCTSLSLVVTMGASSCMSAVLCMEHLLFWGFWEARISQRNGHLYLPRIWGSLEVMLFWFGGV